jgi:cell shape-determining protein MreC
VLQYFYQPDRLKRKGIKVSENKIATLFEEMDALSRQINDLKKEIKRIDSLRQKKASLEEKLSNVAKGVIVELEKVAA